VQIISREEAEKLGFKRFFSGVPCKNGHISERFLAKKACVKCREEYLIKWKETYKERGRLYRIANRDRHAARARKYRIAHKEKLAKIDVERKRRRRENDPVYAITHRLRARINAAYKGTLKPKTTERLIGCSFEEFCQYLESQFKVGMTWENRRQWHIDHIKPLSSFDLSDPEQYKIAFHWTNCQPLWAVENMRKGSKI
jgi:hypothetical protein